MTSFRLLVVALFVAVLAAIPSATPSVGGGAAQAAGAAALQTIRLGTFDATGLLPTGPATGTAQLTIIPDGATLKL